MRKLKLVRQHDEQDCGAACLSMILSYYGRKLPLALIRDEIKVDQHGVNIYGILDGATKNGLNSHAFTGTNDDVWKYIYCKKLNPCIIRINSSGYSHFVVAKGQKGSSVLVYDPGKGKYKMDRTEFENVFLGEIITFEKNKDFTKVNLRKGSISRYTSMVFRQKGLLISTGILSLFVTFVGIIGAFLYQYLLDSVLSNINTSAVDEETIENFIAMVIVFSILYFFRFGVQLLRGILLTKMSKNIDLPLMLGYYDHVTELPMNFFDTHKTGEIISRFNDASKIRDAISNVTLTLFIDVTLVAFCGIVLYKKSPFLFVISLGIFVMYVLIASLFISPLDKINRSMMEQNAKFSSFIKESFDGMETIKVSQAETPVKNKSKRLFTDFLSKTIKSSLLELTKDSLIELITSIGTLTVLLIGTFEVLSGTFSIGELIAFTSLLSYFLSPIQNLVNLQGTLQSALVASDRLNDILDLKPENSMGSEDIEDLTDITVENIDFRYGNRNLVLNNVSFSIKKKQWIGIVGESGCGKSTITKLLMGLYSPEKGGVRINNKPITHYSLSSLRKKTSFVTQSTFLFADTIRNNLLIGLSPENIPCDSEIDKVLSDCCCDFIKEFPFGIDSMLEENAANLSGGQKQRLSIARALLRKPSILILDEATSALDSITEHKIQTTLQNKYHELTVVVVAHRLSTIMNCDNILVLNHGSIIEQGTHHDLIGSHGLYSELWLKQNHSM